MLLNTLVSFFVAKKAGVQRFIIDARASNRHFLKPPSGPLVTSEGLCHVEFQGAPEDAQSWFVGYKIPTPRWLQAFFALSAVFASDVGYNPKRLAPDRMIFPVPTTLPMDSWAMFFLSRCHGPLHALWKC